MFLLVLMQFCCISSENLAISSTDKRPRAIQSVIWPKFLFVWRSETRKEIMGRNSLLFFFYNLDVCFAAKRTVLFRNSASLNAATVAKWDHNEFPPKTGCFLSQCNKIRGLKIFVLLFLFQSTLRVCVTQQRIRFWLQTIFSPNKL